MTSKKRSGGKPNKIIYTEFEDYVQGTFPNGETFLFDYDVYEFVKENSWCQVRGGYVKSGTKGILHRIIMEDELKDGLVVDHINRVVTDNRRSNLRVVTRQENMYNMSTYKTNKSGHVGVSWSKQKKKWRSDIYRDKKHTFLGYFNELQDAINAYQNAKLQFK